MKRLRRGPDLFVGFGGINPFNRQKGIQEIEHAVKNLGFKGVYLHTYSFDIPINHKLYYPFYEKCAELGVGVSMRSGPFSGANAQRSWPSDSDRGHCSRFPELNIVGSHTGWPWVEEMIAMAWKFPNVYIGIDAHMPRYLDESLKKFIKTRGKGKVLYGTNYPLIYHKESIDQIKELNLRSDAEALLLGGAAAKVFNLG